MGSFGGWGGQNRLENPFVSLKTRYASNEKCFASGLSWRTISWCGIRKIRRGIYEGRHFNLAKCVFCALEAPASALHHSHIYLMFISILHKKLSSLLRCWFGLTCLGSDSRPNECVSSLPGLNLPFRRSVVSRRRKPPPEIHENIFVWN